MKQKTNKPGKSGIKQKSLRQLVLESFKRQEKLRQIVLEGFKKQEKFNKQIINRLDNLVKNNNLKE